MIYKMIYKIMSVDELEKAMDLGREILSDMSQTSEIRQDTFEKMSAISTELGLRKHINLSDDPHPFGVTK